MEVHISVQDVARRGGVHQRIVLFIARYPNLNAIQLLALLGVTKRVLSIPLWQSVEMGLVDSVASHTDKRMLQLTKEGSRGNAAV